MPRSSQTFSLRDALLEQARREMLRRKQTTTRSTSFPEWLNDVSPDFTWDWAYLQYIQAHLQKVTDGEIRKLMLFMPPRHGKPIAVHARILMGDGSRKRLADIQTGDTVISHTGAVRRVLAVFEQGLLPVLKITTSTGRTTTAAYDHPFLTTEGWKAARDLVPGMVLANVPRPAYHSEQDGRTDEEYRFAGYFIGDGNTTSSGTATGINARVTCFDPIQAADLAHCAGVMGWGVRLTAKKGSYAFSGGVRPWLRACDLAGKSSREKRVPFWVFQGTPEQIGHFLGAYLACDGSVAKKGAARSDAAVEYYSVNRDLLADVQHLLLRLGIQSRLQLKQGRYLGQIHQSWRLTITSQDDVARFARAIPIVGAKAQTLAAWNVQRRRFDETLLADLIVAVEPAGETACRCITVADDHTFTADDLVVHNSALTTVRYPAYRLERDPQMRVILGCYDQSLANLFSRQTRKIATDRGIRGGEVKAQDEWETIGGGSFRAVGVGGGVTGRGANLLIIDDPIRSREEANSPRWRDKIWDWYTNDIYTRLEPGGAIILIQTRWHEDDLAGRILASPDGPNWTVIMLPAEAEAGDPLGRAEGEALNPARFDIPALHEIKTVLGLDYFALYQQRPMAAEGGLYKKHWFRYIAAEDLAELEFDYILQAWDTASSEMGDWSACVTGGVLHNDVYILDVFKARLETPDLLRAVKDQAAKWGPRMILVEDAASGIAIQQMLRRETKLPVVPIPAFKGGKLSHAQANTPYIEGGRVVFCPGRWLTDFEHELLAFPAGTHDDQVDAFNILLTRIFQNIVKRASSTDGSGRVSTPALAPAPVRRARQL